MTDDYTATKTNQVDSNDDPGQTDVGQSAQGEKSFRTCRKVGCETTKKRNRKPVILHTLEVTVCTGSKGATVGAWTSKGAGRCRERVEE